MRWEPGSRERLQQAALELFAENGFEQTTTAEIAQSVGLTERTFFRYFADKREVLFFGQQELAAAFLDGVSHAPDAAPLELVATAVRQAATYFPDERRPFSRTRQRVIDANPPLQERERHKMASLAAAVGEALRDRGVDEPAATLAAESGMTVFGVAFATWIRDGETRSFEVIAADVFGRLRALAD